MAKRRPVPLLPRHKRQLGRTNHTGCLGVAVRLVGNESKVPGATQSFQICGKMSEKQRPRCQAEGTLGNSRERLGLRRMGRVRIELTTPGFSVLCSTN